MSTPTDRGSAAVETAVLAFPMIALVALLIAAGRMAIVATSVETAARDAARQASIARSAGEARAAALGSARSALSREGLSCPASVRVDTGGFARPVGVAGTVTATVRCPVPLADLLPGFPGHRVISASFTSGLDPYRGR